MSKPEGFISGMVNGLLYVGIGIGVLAVVLCYLLYQLIKLL